MSTPLVPVRPAAIPIALSVSLLISATAADAQQLDSPAPAQESAGNTGQLEEITVTGSRIRGVAPVGSPLIQMGQEDIQKSGQTTLNEVLRQVPQVLNFGVSSGVYAGGATAQFASVNATLVNSVNLRGLAPGATLTLIDGHRVPYSSLLANSFDIDAIPAGALERVEVVADGASAIYGSEAIAGVVNLILRHPFDGAESKLTYGGASGSRQWSAGQTFGKTWGAAGPLEEGGVMLAYEHTWQQRLKASSRSNLYTDDLSAFGGAPSSIAASPGTAIINVTTYAIPAGQNGQSLTLTDLGPAGSANHQNAWQGADALPGYARDSVVINLSQKFSPSVEFTLDGFYSRRAFNFENNPQNSGPAGYTVPASNPFSPCNPAKNQTNPQGIVCPPDGSMQVAYNVLQAYGGSNLRTGSNSSWAVTPALALKLPHDWKITLAHTQSEDSERARDSNYPYAGSIAAALANPDPAAALNVFCDPAASNCLPSTVRQAITGAYATVATYHLQDTTVAADGPLIHLPGGALRLAVGAEYHSDSLRNGTIDYGALFGPPGTVTDQAISNSRNVKAAYGELYVPIFGADNARPGLQSLTFSFAGRIERYSDVGSTRNPKVGLTWVPLRGLSIHSSYGTSFRAPTLVDTSPLAQAGIFPVNYADNQLGLTTNSSRALLYTVGGNPALKPEQARTWSLGLDWAPAAVSGLTTGLNYYHIVYTNKIGTPAYDIGPGAVSAAGRGPYDSFLTYNPTLYPAKATVTPAQFAALLQAASVSVNPPYYGPPGPDPMSVAALVNGLRSNTGVVTTDGFDFSVFYGWDSSFGKWTAGVAGTYVAHYRTAPVSEVPLVDEVNQFLYPVRLRARVQLGWEWHGASLTSYVNYVNPYDIDSSLLPAAAPSQLQHIASYTTLDLTASYDLGATGMAHADGLSVTLSAVNLLGRRPPRVVNSGGTAPVLFDPQNAGPLGRVLTLQVGKKW